MTLLEAMFTGAFIPSKSPALFLSTLGARDSLCEAKRWLRLASELGTQ